MHVSYQNRIGFCATCSKVDWYLFPAYRRDITPEDYKGIADGSLLDDNVGIVLAGLDFHVNYLKLSHAYHYLLRGAVFLATNTDSTLPANHTFFPPNYRRSSYPP